MVIFPKPLKFCLLAWPEPQSSCVTTNMDVNIPSLGYCLAAGNSPAGNCFPFCVWVWIKKKQWVGGHGSVSIQTGNMDSLCYTYTWTYLPSHSLFSVSISHFLLFFFFERKAHLLLWYWKVDHKDLPLVNGFCCWWLTTKNLIFYLNWSPGEWLDLKDNLFSV